MAANYAELQAEVSDWIERTDLTTQIPTFIQMAEAMMNHGLQSAPDVTTRLRVNEMKVSEAYLYGETDDAVIRDYIPHPDDYLELRELRPTGVWTGDAGAEVITKADYAHMTRISDLRLGDQVAYSSGQVAYGNNNAPSEFADNSTADGWDIYSTGGNWEITYAYWQKVPPLTVDDDTNKILTNYPDVYLYGALESAEAFLRLKDTKWRDRFISAMNSANSTTKKAAWSGSNLQTRSPYARSRVI